MIHSLSAAQFFELEFAVLEFINSPVITEGTPILLETDKNLRTTSTVTSTLAGS